jgi:hypothetical protein
MWKKLTPGVGGHLVMDQAWPSELEAVRGAMATIGKLACCSERTVGRALIWLRMFDFLDWQRRIKRTPSRLGMAVRHAYRLGSPSCDASGCATSLLQEAKRKRAPRRGSKAPRLRAAQMGEARSRARARQGRR